MHMNTLARNYAAALIELGRDGLAADAAVRGLMRTLRARGHERLLPTVLRALESGLRQEARANRTQLTVAREHDVKAFAVDIKRAAETIAPSTEQLETVVDERIVGGFILSTRGQQHDASYRRALVALYRAATASPLPATNQL